MTSVSQTLSYNVNLVQKGSCLTGTLKDTFASPTLYLPITGSVNDNRVTFSVTYPSTAGRQGTRTFTGKIDRHGAVSGTWGETGTEGLTGDWTLADSVKSACPPWYHHHHHSFGAPNECKVP